jgi:serine/threonine protein kinase
MADDSAAEDLQLLTVEDEDKLKANSELLTLIKKLSNYNEADTWIGPYAVQRVLGEGATGIVKLANHRDNKEDLVAIKIVDKNAMLSKPDEKKRVLREITILQQVEHPYIMKMYDVFETKQHRFLVLEYLAGGELYDALLKNGKCATEQAFKYFFQITIGIAYLHKNSICHRDVKLENVILDSKGDAKLADFGMASVVPPGAKLMESVGSPHYACPQIIEGKKYSGYCSDVWSLGVVLFILLTGQQPFGGDTMDVLFGNITNVRYKIPLELPDSAGDLIKSILKFNEDERATLHDIQACNWWKLRCGRITPEMRKCWLDVFPQNLAG